MREKVDGRASLAAPAKGRPIYDWCKRALDLTLSVLIIALTAPLWVVIALAIKLETPGPVIFRQKRVGLNGREFVIYKFRSMVHGADVTAHQEAFRRFAEGTPMEEDNHGAKFKSLNDPRVTRVGKLLRATNLDELPQLINVIKGEMSLVGPRPAIPYELQW